MSARLPIMFRGVGSYVPERVVTNQHFADYLDTSDEWIITRTGIRERRYCSAEECTSTMALEASRRALEEAHVNANELDVIVCATATPDHAYPATAAFVQDGLGAGKIPVFDVSAACSGFLYGCAVASGLIVAGMYRNALVIGAETLSRAADPQDRSMCVLFGDAAGRRGAGPRHQFGAGDPVLEAGVRRGQNADDPATGGGVAATGLGSDGG